MAKSPPKIKTIKTIKKLNKDKDTKKDGDKTLDKYPSNKKNDNQVEIIKRYKKGTSDCITRRQGKRAWTECKPSIANIGHETKTVNWSWSWFENAKVVDRYMRQGQNCEVRQRGY